MKRGFKKISNTNKNARYKKINRGLFFVLFIIVGLFGIADSIQEIAYKRKSFDIFTEDVNDIAFWLRGVDKESSKMVLDSKKIVTSYISGQNIFVVNSGELNNVTNTIKTSKDKLINLGFQKYAGPLNVLAGFLDYKNEFFNLLGTEQAQTFLVILQNSAEKRPNGGFFGSFAVIKIKNGILVDLKVIDSYYPNFLNPKGLVKAPDRAEPFLPTQDIGFISANKFGFTNIDGENIKKLYEIIFKEKVAGVIFLRSDLFELISPGFDKKLIERQFVNASIDIIRGVALPNKKEHYIKEINDFLKKNIKHLISNFITNFDKIIATNQVKFYLPSISTGFQNYISRINLATIPTPNKLYIRDSNNSFNKIDRFIKKEILISDKNGRTIFQTFDEYIDLTKLKSGKYSLTVYYTLSVPESYYKLIAELEKKYKIRLTEREIRILGLTPSRESRGFIYFPLSTKILETSGPQYNEIRFSPPFANGYFYQINIDKNNDTKYLKINFEKI